MVIYSKSLTIRSMFDGLARLFDRKKNISMIAGDPKAAVMFLFWPLLLSYIVVAVNGYLGAFWVSMLGAEAASAVNAMMDIYLAVASVGAGIGVASAVTIAFHLGAGDQERANSLASHSIILCFILWIVLGLLMFFFTGSFIVALGIEELKDYCLDYITPLMVCNVVLLLNGALCGILRAEGAAAKATVATLLCVTGGIFDPLFIFGLDLGVAGSAWGTIAGTVVSTGYLLYLFHSDSTVVKISLRNFRLEASILKEHMKVGVPYCIQTTVRRFSNFLDKVIVIAIAGGIFGSATIAVYALPWTYVHMLECLGMAFGAAMIPVMSYNIGRRMKDHATEAFQFTLKKALPPTIIISAGLAIFSGPLIAILATQESLYVYRDTMVMFMVMISVAGPFYTVRDISYSALQTMRKNNLCVLIVFFQIALKLSTMYAGGLIFGYMGLMVFSVISNCIGSAVAYICARYYWKKFDVESLEPTATELSIMAVLEMIRDKLSLKKGTNDS